MTDILPDRDALSQQTSTKAGELQIPHWKSCWLPAVLPELDAVALVTVSGWVAVQSPVAAAGLGDEQRLPGRSGIRRLTDIDRSPRHLAPGRVFGDDVRCGVPGRDLNQEVSIGEGAPGCRAGRAFAPLRSL